MSRISIDVTPEEHQRLKALAALQGESIKEFVLDSTLGARGSEESALAELEALLDRRLRNAPAGGTSRKTTRDIVEQAKREAAGHEPHG